MTIKEMIAAVRNAISECSADEREVYESLLEEAEGWKMLIKELDDDDED